MQKDNIASKDLGNLIDVLTINYESIIYFPFDGELNNSNYVIYHGDSKYSDLIFALVNNDKEKIMSGSFESFSIYEDDRKKLWDDTRTSTIEKNLEFSPLYYIFYRAILNGHVHHFKLKIVADKEGSILKGVVFALIDNEISERAKRMHELELFQAIDDSKNTIAQLTAELKERTMDLSFANGEVIDLLGNVVELRNLESGLHIKRVKTFTRVIAEQVMKDYPEYGLTPDIVNSIVSASSLHDVGKITVPDAILLKHGRLTPEERKEMEKHCEYGLDILRSAPKSWSPQYTKIVLDICYCHHEKWDGNGYPNGLKGDQIPISAQIVSIADCYDALSTERVYKDAYPPEISYNMIINGECGEFSPKILDCFKKCRQKLERILESPDLFHEKALVQLSGKEKLKGLNILLVDDSEMSLDINCDILESEGAKVSTAMNGFEAIDKFVNSSPFDVIIMDLVMPGMDGVEATIRIRELEQNKEQRIPIIALSAEGGSHDYLLNVGIDAVMAKPLIVGELTRILISCMHNSSVQMQKQLEKTLKIANTDALTKVKNVVAYSDMQTSLNREIKENSDLKFAIVVGDINDLKKTNDTYGHETGDIYIKNSCKLLCHAFPHSPVYRIGGDEFVVVLQNEEYNHREESFKNLIINIRNAEQIEEFTSGKASLAVGMSDFDPSRDLDIQSVQRRADMEMYVDKRNKKAGNY